PWTLRRVVHLHRRAGFAATWDELQRDLKEGPKQAVDRLLAGKSTANASADFASVSDSLGDAAIAAGEITRLQAWWVYRMLFGPDPLGEKLTLLWHDHFATGYARVHAVSGLSVVGDLALMRRQHDTLREHARAKFTQLLNPGIREPALLLYLDAPLNRKDFPN